jgi:hypothetical protein
MTGTRSFIGFFITRPDTARDLFALQGLPVLGEVAPNRDEHWDYVRPWPMAMRIKSAVWDTPSLSLIRLSVLATVL